VANTISGDLCVFAKVGDEVKIYLPRDHYEKFHRIGLDEWRRMAASYSAPNDLGLYDEVVNAAWQGAGPQNAIVKSSAQKLRTRIGTYHPRIWRGTFDPRRMHCYNAVDARSVYGSEYIRTNIAASSLFDQMQYLSRYIEPSAANMQAFGNRIRELLILTCTEVEAGWRAVLDQNSVTPKDRYTTGDYFRVAEPLRLLDEFRGHGLRARIFKFLVLSSKRPRRHVARRPGAVPITHPTPGHVRSAALKVHFRGVKPASLDPGLVGPT